MDKNEDIEFKQSIKDKLNKMSEFNSSQYNQIKSDLEFADGVQWDTKVKGERDKDGRPTITVNMIKTYINRVVNPLRLNPIGIRVSSDNEKFTELVSGVIREIEYKSNAKESYERAYENAVTAGLGWIVVGTNYKNNKSLEQKLTIDIVNDPTNVYLDPYSQCPTGSDAKYGVYVKYIDEEDAKETYGDEISNGATLGTDLFSEWLIPDGSVASMVFYQLETTTKSQYYYIDGAVTDTPLSDVEYNTKRTIEETVCKCYHFIGSKLCEETSLPIDFIPIISVQGDKLYLEDDSSLRVGGIVHNGRPQQQLINFYSSNELELAALAPKTPFVGAEGQFEGHENRWGTANTKNHAYLEYVPVSLNGTMAPAPNRMDNTANTGGLIQSKSQAISDLGRGLGMFDNFLGGSDTANESGRSILLRQNQGELATAQYLQNLQASIKQVGRVILQLIPYVYDTDRTFTVRLEDGTNEQLTDNLSKYFTPELLESLDIETNAGPAYEGKRREAIASMLEIGQMMPDKVATFADVLVRNLDAPGSEEIANRLKKMIPPEILGEQQGPPPIPPEMQEAMAQAQGTIQNQQSQLIQMQNTVAQLQTMLLSKEQEVQAKMYNGERDREHQANMQVLKSQTTLSQEQMKQSGSNYRQSEEIEADFEMEASKIQKDYQMKQVPTPKDDLDLAKLQFEVNKTVQPRLPRVPSLDFSDSQATINSLGRFIQE